MTPPRRSTIRLIARRRGGIYLAVLGSAMVVSILGLSALTVARLELLESEAGTDTVKSRAFAESAVELGMLEIQANPLWRQKPHGAWATDAAMGDGAYTLEVTDPLDGNLGNGSRDPVRVRGTGIKGQARHIVEVTMVNTGEPISALSSGLIGAGGVTIDAGRTLSLSGAPVSSAGTLTNNGVINGSARALVILNNGTITGSSTILTIGDTFPAAGVPALYQKMGASIAPGSDLERCVLAPAFTTYGPTNKDGIYVVTAPAGLRVRRARIEGTLVVLASGATVTIEDSVSIQNYRRDCPAIIVDGNLVLGFVSGQPLSESAEAVNFNPPLAPYQGVSDNDQADQYPSEIRGLVHATGTVTFQQTPKIRGCVIAQGTPPLAPGVLVAGNAEITHDPALVTNPPIGYSVAATMEQRPGSWTRVTLP